MNDSLDIKLELVKRGITQRRLALYLGMSESWLSDALKNIRPVSSDLIREIRQAIEELSEAELATPNRRRI